MPAEPIDLAAKLALIHEPWSPRVVAELNDVQFKLVKLQGEFTWHAHAGTDEAFLVLEGELELGFRDRSVVLRPGQLLVVPRGVEHVTRSARGCSALVIEPRGTLNTGDAGGPLTARNDVWI